MSNSDKKYPLAVTPLWSRGQYALQGIVVNDEQLTKLAGVQAGGKFIIRFLSDKSRKSEKSPKAYLEYLTPEEVAASKAAFETRQQESDSDGI